MQDWMEIVEAAHVGGWVVYPLTLLAVLAIAITLDRGGSGNLDSRLGGVAGF
jgi:biopolymer transport protein ExbB